MQRTYPKFLSGQARKIIDTWCVSNKRNFGSVSSRDVPSNHSSIPVIIFPGRCHLAKLGGCSFLLSAFFKAALTFHGASWAWMPSGFSCFCLLSASKSAEKRPVSCVVAEGLLAGTGSALLLLGGSFSKLPPPLLSSARNI